MLIAPGFMNEHPELFNYAGARRTMKPCNISTMPTIQTFEGMNEIYSKIILRLIHIKSKSSEKDLGLAGFFWIKCGNTYNSVVKKVIPSNVAPVEKSFLDQDLLMKPEAAIVAVIQELQRVTRICKTSFQRVTKTVLFDFNYQNLNFDLH